MDNSGYEVSLERRKIYVPLPNTTAEKLGQLQIVDESGEDYLYQKNALSRSRCRSRFAEPSSPARLTSAGEVDEPGGGCMALALQTAGQPTARSE